MIRLEHLNKYYNKNRRNEYHVINDINYEFKDKGLYSFFGPSGCGKTTLLNVIGCLDNFDSGNIVFDEYSFSKYHPKNADEIRNNIIGYIFQNYNLVETKNVYENVEIVLDMIGITNKEEKKIRISNCLKAVGMYKHRKRNVLALSGGERQRVAIARALAKNPKIILADEPTGNLDSNNTFEVMNIIKKISRDKLVILVSHEGNLVNYYSDYIIELRDGMIVDEYENINNNELSHSDSRNIYLKDYEKKELNNEAANFNFYGNSGDIKVNIDIIYKNGEIYIKPQSNAKIHLIEEGSEVKLLDMSEKEYNIEKQKVESDFTFDYFDNSELYSKKKKRYISLFTSIKNSFKKTGYVKRNKFMNFTLVITGIIFAILFSLLSNVLTVEKDDYITTPNDSLCVTLGSKDKRNGYDFEDVIKDAKEIDGYISFGLPTTSNNAPRAEFDLQRYMQTTYSSCNTVFCPAIDKNNIDVNYGNKISSKNDVVITTWIADIVLDNIYAKKNGINSYDDLIGNKISFSNYSSYDNNFIVSGIVDEDTKCVYMEEEIYNSMYFYEYYADSIYIVTSNKELMISKLSEKYQNVEDANEGTKLRAFKNKVKSQKTTLIVLGVMSVAIFIYMSLIIRSSLFGKIKEVGTLRSIGATKKDIMHIFLGDTITITSKISFVFYSITFLFIMYFSMQYDVSEFGIKLFNANLSTYVIGVIFIYILNIVSTIIPVALLMNKTPVEIIKKYDI